MMNLRRLSLVLSGLTFGGIAVLAAIAPVAVARTYGLSLLGVDGLAEFRAVYMGFWASLAIAMLTAARRPDDTLLGDICGVMLLFQSLARMVSFALDGRPSAPFVVACFAELTGAIMILAPRVMNRRHAEAA
jgi:Domain of unknown function (DUF4345)